MPHRIALWRTFSVASVLLLVFSVVRLFLSPLMLVANRSAVLSCPLASFLIYGTGIGNLSNYHKTKEKTFSNLR
jgi:hypothetical protein